MKRCAAVLCCAKEHTGQCQLITTAACLRIRRLSKRHRLATMCSYRRGRSTTTHPPWMVVSRTPWWVCLPMPCPPRLARRDRWGCPDLCCACCTVWLGCAPSLTAVCARFAAPVVPNLNSALLEALLPRPLASGLSVKPRARLKAATRQACDDTAWGSVQRNNCCMRCAR